MFYPNRIGNRLANYLVLKIWLLLVLQRWLEKWPKKAAFVRLAGEGDWHHQFKAVALLWISPFPYIVFNYASVATNVKYYPYIAGSMAGTIHETFLAIYRFVLTSCLLFFWSFFFCSLIMPDTHCGEFVLLNKYTTLWMKPLACYIWFTLCDSWFF